MSNHLLAVLACWLVALCGLAMFVRATSWRGQCAGHAAVVVAMLSLSAMALDHDHADPVAYEPLLGAVGDPVYHRAGCPLATRGILFRSRDEAEWINKIPCTFCLAEHAQHDPDDHEENHRRPDSGE